MSSSSKDASVGSDDEVSMELTVVYCLVILKKTGAQMRESYLTYEIMKRTKREAALEFRDFVFMHTVSEVPLFVLEHTKFAFDMMVLPPCSDQPPKPEVELKRFLMYATNFGLCSPLFATELFQCLQNREQKLEFESFRGFVEGLRKSRKDILEHMPMLSHIPDVQEDEAIVVYRALMLETSHRPPRMGCLLLCRHHIIFETSLFKTRHIYPYSSLRLDDNTVKLYCEKTQQAVVGGKPGATSPTDATCALDLEPIGFGEQLEKDKEFFACYLRDMMTVHMLTKKLPSNLRNVMLDDVCRRVQTDWVLYELGFPRPRVSAFYHAREEATYVRFQEKCASTFVKKRRTSFWGPLGNKPAAALDPDPEQTSSSIMPSVGNKNNEAADGTDEPSSSAIAQKAQEFDYKLFAHNVGLFVDYMQPLFIMHECSLSLKNWDYPWLSLSLFIFLLTAAYHNLTVHLPAVLVGSNLLVLAYCRYDATRVKKALKIDHEEEDIKEAEAEYDYKTSNVFSRFSKWKQRVKVNMSKVMSGLESMHDFLSIVNDKLVRFGCLYLWSTTKASTYYTLAMVTFGLLYYCLPFNVLFALWVTDFFTDKFQPQHPDGNLFMRLLAMVHVTDRIDPTASVIPFCVCCNACVIHPAFTTEAPPEGVHESKESSAAGWLEKRRGFLGKWHPRWFVIGGSHLVYYQSEADVGQTAPKGVVHLSHAVISDAGPGEKGGTQLYIQEPLKAKMTLQASSVGEKHQWLVALTDARLKSPVLPAAFEVLPDEHPQPPKK